MTDDTPRDPLAALLLAGLCEINSDGEDFPHTPDEDDCPVVEELRPASSRLAQYLTENGVTLDADRPSGDDPLRAALVEIRDMTFDQPAAVNVPISEWNYRLATRAVSIARAALATPASSDE